MRFVLLSFFVSTYNIYTLNTRVRLGGASLISPCEECPRARVGAVAVAIISARYYETTIADRANRRLAHEAPDKFLRFVSVPCLWLATTCGERRPHHLALERVRVDRGCENCDRRKRRQGSPCSTASYATAIRGGGHASGSVACPPEQGCRSLGSQRTQPRAACST